MGHTDVHRPSWVQKADPLERHRFYRFQLWSTQSPSLIALRNLCGCQLCTDRFGRRQQRRRERHQAKQQLRRGE